MVIDTDGSAFITKAEFDSLKNNFQSQIDNYNTSIDSKIDGAIAAYLAGVKTSSINPITPIMGTDLVFETGLATSVTYNSTFQSYYANWPYNAGSSPIIVAVDQYNSQMSRMTLNWGSRNYGYGYCMGSDADGIVSVDKYDDSKFYYSDGTKKYKPERYFWVVDDINKTKPVCIGCAALCPNQYSNKSGAHLWAGDTGSGAPIFTLSHNHPMYTTYWSTGISKPIIESSVTIDRNTVKMQWIGKYAGSYQGGSSSPSEDNTYKLNVLGSVFTYGNSDGTTVPKNLNTNYSEGYATHHWNYKQKLDKLWCCGAYANPTLWKFDTTNYVNWTLNKTYTFEGQLNMNSNSRTTKYSGHTLISTGNIDKDWFKDTITLYGMDADTALDQLIAKPYENFQTYGTHYWDGAILYDSKEDANLTIKLKENSNKRIYFQSEPFTNAATPTASLPFKVNGTTYSSGFTPVANTEYTITIENFPKNKQLYIKPAGACTITIDEMQYETE